MKPILFDEATTEFTTNGIGRLSDAISCICTEERNGVYEVEMVYPVSGIHYSDIRIRNIIVVKPSANADLQAFRIYKITKPINGKVSVFAQHLTYDLSKNTCMPFSVTASASACDSVLQGLKTNAVETCPFVFWTDVTTIAPYSQKIPSSIRQRLGGIEGSVLDQFGGEYEWDNYTVKLHRHRGIERDITYRYGKNITDINQEENIANTVTGVVPYWSDAEGENIVTLPEKAVYSANASRYSENLTVPLDLSASWDKAPTETQLRNMATIYVNQSGFGVPKVSIKVSFVNLADTEEYKNVLPLENVSLCDVITVQFTPLGIDTTAKIVKTIYDVLKEKYNEVQIGDLRSTMASTITDIEAGMTKEILDTFAKTSDIVANATAWLTSAGGYVVAVKNDDGSWKELLFMDNDDPAEAINVLRINMNGIGFSRSGLAGPYVSAWTIDGNFNADFIKTGEIDADRMSTNVISAINSSDKSVYLTFDDRCESEGTYDYVRFWYVENGSVYSSEKYSGSSLRGNPIKIPKSSFYVEWYSDTSVQKWGIKCTGGGLGDQGDLVSFSLASSLPSWQVSEIGPYVTNIETNHPYYDNERVLWHVSFSDGSLLINADKININGTVTLTDLANGLESGATVISGDCIRTGTLEGITLIAGDDTGSKMVIENGAISCYWLGSKIATIKATQHQSITGATFNYLTLQTESGYSDRIEMPGTVKIGNLYFDQIFPDEWGHQGYSDTVIVTGWNGNQVRLTFTNGILTNVS